MPPELLSKKNIVASPALDVWALGCILYYMVLGKLPFRGDHLEDIKRKIIKEKHTYPADAGISPEVRDLIDRMLEKEPEKRASIYEISDHAWSNNRAFTDEEKAKIKERIEAELVLQAQMEEQTKTDDSPISKKVPASGSYGKKQLIPSPERPRPLHFGVASALAQHKKLVLQMKDQERDGARKQSENKANVK